MATELFRKSALETLSSPEQLDQLMKLTSPRTWIAFYAIALVIIAAILWSIFGSLATSASGPGIIMRKGGVFDIVVAGSGTISNLQDFKIGDKIKKGQVLGQISQRALAQKVLVAKADLDRLRLEEKAIQTAVSMESNVQTASYKLQQAMQSNVIHAKQDRLRSLKTVEQQQAELLRDGLITSQRHEETKQAIYAAQNEIAEAKSALQQQLVQQTETGSQHRDRIRNQGSLVAQAVNRLNELELQFQLAANVVSEQDGVVVEMLAMNGDAVKDGQAILSIEIEQKMLEATIYLPPGSSRKLVKPGMSAQLSLATSKKERYGYLIGKVLSVSEYPATEQGMMAIFNNTLLVQDITKSGDPLAVSVQLIPDDKSKSGYAWSSQAGASVEVLSGTLCVGSFVVESHRPISLVIPMLKETIGW
jgi:HlyD family secretion protein